MRRLWTVTVLCCGVAMTGCVAEVEGSADDLDEPTAESHGALVGGNALTANALNLNALNLNALNLNALNLNALSSGNLAAIRDPSATGALAREALRYLVGCALGGSQSFAFDWTDSSGAVHHESYPGQLGVATGWATAPLGLDAQRMVSACMAARVNYYQVPVVISARSLTEPLKTLTNDQELQDYPDVEGAFWGNLFAGQPFINACYNTATVSNSRAWKRDCAAGHPTSGGQIQECGMIRIVGSCSSVCQTLNGAGQYYPSCVERPGIATTTIKLVVTTGLP